MSNWNDRLDKGDEEPQEGFVRLEEQIKASAAESDRRSALLEEQIKASITASDKRFARLEGQINAHRQETKEGFAEADRRFEKVDERLAQTATRPEMNEGLAELRSAYSTLTVALLVGAITLIAALVGTQLA